ncbi:hypothetical protein PISMIDRAFT_111544 [Pisolithus microcarpus 441]|uniref:Uncharacterized protein n=1 Tax=Pisolithus microcarpus 441 TaxID=765257 RepID=A0A0C9ZBS9_9AGAM|nr:hypothetical protein PISMIDRAFT_111544 [Pisolithus microcarpus 441]
MELCRLESTSDSHRSISEPLCHPTQPHHLPTRFRDILPEPPVPVAADPPAARCIPCVILHVFDSFHSAFNVFGIARKYHHHPSYDPDSFLSPDELSDARSHMTADNRAETNPMPPPWPFQTMSVWRLMRWMLSSSKQKSEAEVSRLVSTVITADDFWLEDLRNFNAHMELKRFDMSEEDHQADHVFRKDGWTETSVSIEIPTRDCNPDGNGQTFNVPSFFYHKLTAAVEAAFSKCTSRFFHLTPFRCIWQSPVTGKEQWLYDELYTSDTWIKAHDKVQKQRCDDGCTLERIIAGLMFSSDAMHLTQFGHASAWPVYLFFGNQSKYMWA